MIDTITALDARDDALAVAAAWDSLRARLVPSGSSQGGGARTIPGSRVPLDVSVSDLLGEIEFQARGYARELMDETDDWTPTTSTMPGLLREVAARYGHWTAGEDDHAGLEFCDTWHELRRKVAGVLERPAPPRWMGPCTVPECGGELRLREGREVARCPECGAQVGLLEIRAHLYEALRERLMTRSEIMSALFVLGLETKPKTVDKWVERGKLERVVVDPDLFRLDQARDLAMRAVRVAA